MAKAFRTAAEYARLDPHYYGEQREKRVAYFIQKAEQYEAQA